MITIQKAFELIACNNPQAITQSLADHGIIESKTVLPPQECYVHLATLYNTNEFGKRQLLRRIVNVPFDPNGACADEIKALEL